MTWMQILRGAGLGLLVAGMAPDAATAQPVASEHQYVVTVDFATAPENFERFKTIMNDNAKASALDEPGCRQFDVYEVAASPNHLMLYEVYDDEAAFQQHVNSDHFKRYSAAWKPLITSQSGTRGTMFAAYRKGQ